MLETLLAQGVERKDSKRLSAMLRPLPAKQRDAFDLIIAQGREPSFQGIVRSVELKGADPRSLTFVLLGRWPTAAELAELPNPYQPKPHLKQLLQSDEFRQTFGRRLLDAFPDRRRMLFVRIPRSAGDHVLATAANRHPVVPASVANAAHMPLPDLLATLGGALYRFNAGSTVVLASPRLQPFMAPVQPPPAGEDTLHWNLIPPPYRAGDLLFAVIRDPRQLLLSQVNATLATQSDPPPLSDAGAWKDLGRKTVQSLTLANPICQALGEGTSETALNYCRASGIELVGLSRQIDWVRTAFSSEPPPPTNVSQPILRLEDLRPEDHAHLDALLTEDTKFHARFADKFDPTHVSAITGARL
jgi:hypothetical protein